MKTRIAVAALCVAMVPSLSKAVAPLNNIDDVRVGPLMTTTWAQGDVGSSPCYNYYTPLNRVCGCTATAIAQIMFYHKYPTERILPGESLYDDIDDYGSYSVNTNGIGGMTKSSDGTYTPFAPDYGGPYAWSSMVASPASGTSDAARRAIGQLTRDVGFAVFSHYYSNGSTSGYAAARASSLILNLRFADAVKTGFNLNKLIANLDAGLPVMLGLTGHEVVADGYGYDSNGTLYIHINYGHADSNSGWYDPSYTIGSGNKSIQDMVANIFPPTRGARHSSVISGRVLDAGGNPVANATVTATADGLPTVTTNSNANGTYAFILPAGTYTFTATSGGDTGALTSCAVEASEQSTRGEIDEPWNHVSFWSSGVNNSRSGVNVTLGKTVGNEPDAYIEYVQSDGRQYVVPDLRGRTNMRIEADIDWISGRDVAGCTWNECFPLQSVNGNIGGQFVGSGTADTGVALNSGRHLVVADATLGSKFSVTVYNVSGIEIASATSSGNAGSKKANGDCGNNIHVFGALYADGDRCSAKLYGMKIYLDGVLERDLVPGVKAGVAGLYDRQKDKWYVSQSGTALIAGPVFTPTSPTPTEFSTSQQTFVTLDCATEGATIYYTTDGSDPTTSSTVYSAPFAVTSGTTVKARAYRTGLQESAIYSATFTYVSMVSLTHRWSFNGEGTDYTDTQTGSSASPFGNDATKRQTTGGKLVLCGDGPKTASLDLGKNLLGSGNATVEIWASHDAVKNHARVFDYGNGSWGSSPNQTDCFIFRWTYGTDATMDMVSLKSANTTIIDERGTMSPMELGKQYYFAFTFKDNGDGSTTIKWMRRDVATGALELHTEQTVSDWTLADLAATNPDFWLGVSKWQSNYDANASYDEVRIWDGVVGDDQLAANAAMGPDVYTSGLEEGFTLADNAVFNVPAEGYASSGIVTLGAGSKLRFDTSSMQWDDAVSFSALGFTVPSGSILDYVEPQDSSNFKVTLSGNTITVTRLRQNEPDAYLEFVATTGAQYFDLGFEGYSTMTFEADIDWVSGTYFVGSTWNETYPLKNAGGKIGGELLGSGTATSSVALDTGRHTVVSRGVHGSRLSIMVDGVEVTSSSNCGSKKPKTGQTMLLFAAKNNVSTEANFSGRLYSLNISTNGVMAHQFVPGIKDGVAGLYDRLNDVWYVSGSGTELIPGPVKERHNEPQVYLDYVKSTGAQWVETKFMPSRTMTVEADLDWISGVVLSQNHYDIRVLSPNNGCIAGSTYSYSSYATTDVPLNSGRHHVVVKSVDGQKLKVSVDGAAPAEAGSASNRSCTPPSLYIFAAHSGGGTSYSDAATAKLYGLKMYDSNGILKRDFVPGIKDNVVGLYDRVSDMFYSSGSGTPLEAGPAIERSKPDAFVEYVESNGSQRVDTGVDGRAGVKSEADIDWISGSPLGVIGNSHCLLLQDLSGIGGQARGSGEVKTGVAVNSGRHLIVSEVGNDSKMTVTVDGTTSATSVNNASGSTGVTIWMFAAHNYNNGGAWGAGRSKFYGLKLWQTGSDGICRLQRHFIPCVKDSRAGLYDAVSGVIFYSHSGTDLSASSTEVPLAVWRNESDDALLDNAANWCGDLQNATDTVLCAPWLTSVSSANGLAVSNLTVTGGNLAFADGTNTVAGTLTADGALAFTNLVINGSADCAVAISGFISGHGTVTSLTLDEGARFVPDGTGYLTITDALVGTMLIDMTDINLSGETGRFPLFKTGTVDILPAVSSVEFVGGRPPSGRNLINVKSGFGYDLTAGNFMILLR